MILEQIMLDTKYILNSSTIDYTVGFEGDQIYCEMFKRLKQCGLNQVVKVTKKKTSLGAGDEVSFRIYFVENGKEKKFPWIQANIADVNTKSFFEDLKGRLGTHVLWEDRTKVKNQGVEGMMSYDLQYLPFGYGGAGLSRAIQIWIYTICLGLLILPLFYYIPVLIKGGYRIYTDDSGLEVRKFGSKKFAWNSIKEVRLTYVKIKDMKNHSTTKVMKINFSVESKNHKLVMRYDSAVPLLKEMHERDIIGEELIKDFL